SEKVYRTDCLSVLSNTLKLALSVFLNTAGIPQPLALLDNAPLKKLLEEVINFHDMDEAIASGYLKAVAITAMSYSTGQSISFFQGDHNNWQRARRMGLRTGLTLDHLMASAAIPTLFPPVKIGTRYFGDGALRQLKPLSPALHLGADRLFVIGVSDNAVHRNRPEASYRSPTIAQMIGHMLNSAFIDTLESDLETLRAINKIARSIDASNCEHPDSADIKYVEYLTITPSRAINELAEHYVHELPRTVRTFLRVTGAKAGESGS